MEPSDTSVKDGQPREQATQRFATKLTPEVQNEVVRALAGGVPPEVAAAYAGIVRSTFYEWLKLGRAAIARANGNAEEIIATDEHAGFAFAVDQAQARFMVGNMAAIGAAGRQKTEGEWQALAWQLERRFPAMFGRKTRHEVTGKDGKPIQVENAIILPPGALDRLPLSRKLALAEILQEIDGDVIDADEEPPQLALEP